MLGRWHSQDPLIAYASPYNGIGNNPVNLIDRWGMCPGNPPEGGGGSSGGYGGGGWSLFFEGGIPNYFYAGGQSYSSDQYYNMSWEAQRSGYTQNMSQDDAVRRVIWENRNNETATRTVINHPSEGLLRALYSERLDDMKNKKLLNGKGIPIPSAGDPCDAPIDNCGINSYELFSNLTKAEAYLKNNADCNKEKFLYILKNDWVIVGPWNDATLCTVSPRYLDRFKGNGYQKGGTFNFGGQTYEIQYFAHSHPFDKYASDIDGRVYDYFNYYNIPTLIYYNYNFYYHEYETKSIIYLH